MRSIISTVGTSLLVNARRKLGLPDGVLPAGPEIDNFLAHGEAVRCSAETNSLSRLLRTDDRLIFLSSPTPEGRFCAEALQRHYLRAGKPCASHIIPDLDYQAAGFKVRGLRALVSKLVSLIREETRQGRTPILNATGGFKAEIAYAVLIGQLFDISVYYIHEGFQEIIEMPAVPIGWDMTLLADNEDFFEWVTADKRPTELVEERMRQEQIPDEARLLLAEEGGETGLSPTGEAFFESYLDALSKAETVPLLLSSNAAESYAQADATWQAVLDRTFRKLCCPTLRHSGSDMVSHCDCRVFPKGRRPERIFYFTQESNVYVCELTSHADQSYERWIRRGVNRDAYPPESFTSWKTG